MYVEIIFFVRLIGTQKYPSSLVSGDNLLNMQLAHHGYLILTHLHTRDLRDFPMYRFCPPTPSQKCVKI